jgi:prophage regulatory protein
MATLQVLPTINPIHRLPVVTQATGYSRSTLYRKIQENLFTRPVSLGADKSGKACQVGWPANEVQALIDARIAGKSDDEIKVIVKKLESSRGNKTIGQIGEK